MLNMVRTVVREGKIERWNQWTSPKTPPCS
jgi:hypothetical protein